MFIRIQEMLHGSEDDVLWEDSCACGAEESDDDADQNDNVYEDDSDDDTPSPSSETFTLYLMMTMMRKNLKDFDVRVTRVVSNTKTIQCYKIRADFYVPQI